MVALASVKAAPGVTTLTLALGAVWPGVERVVVAELDPAGGDLAAWLGLDPQPGLVSLAPAARRAPAVRVLHEHTQPLADGLEALVGPVSGEQARSALTMLPPELLAGLDQDPDVIVVADCGRLHPASPAAGIARQASVLVLVARPVAAELGHVAALRGWLRGHARAHGLVVVGAGPYAREVIAEALTVQVLGVVPADPRGAARLTGARDRPRRLRRAPLLRAARDLAATLHQAANPAGGGPSATHAPRRDPTPWRQDEGSW